ncbi:transcription elongation regulator 1 isoform X2 [Drosophila busckii]|uniref:transcription elongation regulator 1 isoform X2 n=1 Tax=Drosophila busckii TaxID=30019 RepID=UPI00083ED3E5|nr:transcription elongation regulator 1 isoform X2 [Drosophila busckii]
METSLDDSMDGEHSSPSPEDSLSRSPPSINGKSGGVGVNVSAGGGGGSGPNGVSIGNEKTTSNQSTWNKPFNAFSGRPMGDRTQMQHQQAGQHSALSQPSSSANGLTSTQEIWVETKAEDGRSYYYHAVTRETTWTRPEGQNIKIMTQSEVEELAKRPSNAAQKTDSERADAVAPASGAGPAHLTSQPPPHLLNQPPPNAATSLLNQPPPNVQRQPPPMFQQPPGMQAPPGFGQPPPFCMPPPAFQHGFPGSAPAGPWGVGVPPWQQQHMHAPPVASQDKPAKTLIIKPGVIDPAVIARAAEWSEHRAPDGRPYYFHAGRGESVWEKPQALRDMEAARMAAHSGAAPQTASAAAPNGMPPHLLPNPLMHLPPGGATGFDQQMAFAAAAAAMKANTENSKAAQAAALESEAKKKVEEKRKKDEEHHKKLAATARQTDKSRPVTSTPIAGTPWCVVWTGDARVFFYNPSTRTSVWERPEDLMNREDVDKAVNDRPEQLKTPEEKSTEAEQKTTANANTNVSAVAQDQSAPGHEALQVQQVQVGEDEDDEVIKIRTESESSVEEVPTKRVRTFTKAKKNEDAVLEAEQRAAKERALVPLETRVTQFKEMLREKDVSAFSTWEKELHKIVFDPRYLLLTSKERKQVFEKYVKDRAEEERKEKRNKMRQKRDDFRKLMEEAKLHGKSSFSEFSQRNAKDERYRAIEKVRERESLFNEYIVEVRRREKEDKQLRKEQIRKDFLDMLRERHDIERHTRWYDIKKKFESDARYRAVDSAYREEYFEDYLHMMKEEKRRDRELREQRDREKQRERKSDRHDREKDKDKEKSRKSSRKDRSRSRERERKSSRDKEEKSRSERKKEDTPEEGEDIDDSEELEERAGSHDSELARQRETEAEQKQNDRERKLRAEKSIREREKEVHRTLAGHLRDRDKEREHHKRDECIGHFTALLTDLVRTPDFTWKEIKRQLRKDHRWELIETLDRDDRERIFNEHIDNLMKKKREKFREMLDEITTLMLTSTWKEIKKLVKEDPRFLKYSSDKGEREYRDYIKDKTIQAKTALRELFQECKFITHKSRDLIKENPNHLKEIQDILKNDKRYLVLDHMEEERGGMLLAYLDEMNKRGPPPPPTASESTRRNNFSN